MWCNRSSLWWHPGYHIHDLTVVFNQVYNHNGLQLIDNGYLVGCSNLVVNTGPWVVFCSLPNFLCTSTNCHYLVQSSYENTTAKEPFLTESTTWTGRRVQNEMGYFLRSVKVLFVRPCEWVLTHYLHTTNPKLNLKLLNPTPIHFFFCLTSFQFLFFTVTIVLFE